MVESDVERNLRQVTAQPPSGYFVVVSPRGDEDAIDLTALIAVLRKSWKWLFVAAVLGGIIAAAISLQMRKVYQAQVLVAQVAAQGRGVSSLTNQLGGLAALAGIDIGSTGGRKEESFATLASAGFAREFIQTNNLLPILFDTKWDATTKRWRDGKPPSLESAMKKFTEKVATVAEDRKTGLVTVSIEWYSPQLAAQWANLLVDRANERLRAAAINNAERSVAYLEQELAKTNVVELRQAIYNLIEDQVNNAMLANVQREYAFRVIDPAVPPETRISPKRTAITLAGVVLGLLVGALTALVMHGLRRKEHV